VPLNQTDSHVQNRKWAYSLLRFVLGMIFCEHSFVRIVTGLSRFANATTQHLSSGILPHGIIYSYACAIPVLEAILGILLVLGVFLRPTLIAGSLFMVSLTIGSASIQDWNIVGQQLVYSIVFFLLLFFMEYDCFSVDSLRRHSTTM
jgi:thiosulfate dehydrogenase (quinone) large subunit